MDTFEYLNYLILVDSLKNEIRVKQHPLENLSDHQVFLKYHFSIEGIGFIFNLIKDDLIRSGIPNSTDISPVVELLTALRFYATGSFQLVVSDTIGISQPATSIIVKKISKLIARKWDNFIKWPNEAEAIKQRTLFHAIANFPGIVGAIDCTHIAITCPGGVTSELFRNRKGYFSINVQAVCDAEDKFINVVCRWPGSTHDARIFDNCNLQFQLENKVVPGNLVGDSGYGLATYLFIPHEKPATQKQKRYNFSLIRTRNPIERAFGQLKKKFPCLLEILRTQTRTTLDIIIACFVLHNIAKILKEEEIIGPDAPTEEMGIPFRTQPTSSANAYRNAFIERHF